MIVAQKKQNFEQSLKRLEGIVQRLESGELNLEKSMAAFEEGIKLAQELDEALSRAEAKVSMLLDRAGGAGGAGGADAAKDEKPWPEADVLEDDDVGGKGGDGGDRGEGGNRGEAGGF